MERWEVSRDLEHNTEFVKVSSFLAGFYLLLYIISLFSSNALPGSGEFL